MWRRKFPKPRVINFVVRCNRVYRVLFRNNELFVDDKLIWTRENENVGLNIRYLINVIGTSPQNFRRRMKKMKKKRLKDKGKILEKDSFIERK